MRLIFKIIFGLGLFFILYTLSPPPIYALACSGTGYTCRRFDCAPGEVEDTTRKCTRNNYICCKKVPTSTPKPQPTNTPGGGPGAASPTATRTPTPTPKTGGADCPNPTYPSCSGSNYCTVINCGKTIANCPPPPIPTVPNCSSSCLNNHCYTTNPNTNPTITNVPCSSPNDYGPWSGCLSGQAACGGCAAQNYTCQVRYCINPPNSNQYQISCGCTQPTSGGGGGGGSNPYLSIQLVDPSLAFWCATLGMTT